MKLKRLPKMRQIPNAVLRLRSSVAGEPEFSCCQNYGVRGPHSIWSPCGTSLANYRKRVVTPIVSDHRTTGGL